MVGRRRLCCGSLLLLLVVGQLLLMVRMRGHTVPTEHAAAYFGEEHVDVRQLVSAPDSAPDDGSAPDSAPDDDSAPDSAPDDGSALDSAPDDDSAPDSAPDDGSALDSAPDDGSAPDSAAAAAADDSAGSESGSAPDVLLDEKPPHLIIILSSSPRSGSSLLGEILSTSPNTVYFFEPFYYHVKNNISVSQLPAAEVQQTLRQLLTCRLNQTVVMREAKYRRFIWRPAARPRVTPGTSVLTRHCEAATTRVVKLVRPRLSQLVTLLQDPELGPRLWLVHLVRDPRGTLNSQLHAGTVWKKLTNNLDVYCDGLRADLAAARRLHAPRYQRVYYERLALQPEHVAAELYRGMQLPQPAMLHTYFERHMNSSGLEAPRPPPARGRAAGPARWRGPQPPAESRSELTQRHSELTQRRSELTQRHSQLTQHRTAMGRVKRAVPPAGQPPAHRLSRLGKQTKLKQQQQQQRRQRLRQSRARKEGVQYFSTYRGPGFDPYHWRKELKPELLQQLEHHCADVIGELEAEVSPLLGR